MLRGPHERDQNDQLPGRPPGIRADAEGLTQRQRAVIDCIRESMQTRGYPPSMREIGAHAGLSSTSSVAHQVSALERKGVLRKDPHRPRAYVLSSSFDTRGTPEPEGEPEAPHAAMVEAPLVGRIAAGHPILAEQNVEDVFPLPRLLVGDGELFVLKVVGDSMTKAAICDGDWVTVRRQPVVENGDIVVAMLDGEATVKRLRRDGINVWLMPENDAFSPLPANEATILGRVVAVMRSV
ncbi:transcriptional repressor LexA [Streptomyces sp. NPDC004549]|uniref:transcriptional repressor LexA n=1 Tax=Streptomyces sp. NPDC004549 TaxID=3154283 RepID=UPI0033A43E6B